MTAATSATANKHQNFTGFFVSIPLPNSSIIKSKVTRFVIQAICKRITELSQSPLQERGSEFEPASSPAGLTYLKNGNKMEHSHRRNTATTARSCTCEISPRSLTSVSKLYITKSLYAFHQMINTIPAKMLS